MVYMSAILSCLNGMYIYRENVDDAAYGPYWCLVNTSSNTAATISNTARIEESVRTPSPGTVPKGGTIVNGNRAEGKGCCYVR